MHRTHMREFWNERAREDAYFFVDDRRAYRDTELSEFWADGEHVIDRFQELLEVQIEPTDTVLDIGCGVGRLTRALARLAGHVYGIDVSGEMIERARAHHPDLDNVDWLVGDGTSLRPLENASVDACLSHVVFQHIPDPRITLGYVAEMGRVLKPGGWSAFQVSNDAQVHRMRGGAGAKLRRLGSLVGRAPSGQDDPAWLGSAVDLGDLRTVATRSGLLVERLVGERTQFCLVLVRREG